MVAHFPGDSEKAEVLPVSNWFVRAYAETRRRFVSARQVVRAERAHARVAQPSFEQKFLFAACYRDRVFTHLKYTLRPDLRYEKGTISSIYYDTPTLRFYNEKRASDFLKTKVRLRWYGRITADSGDIECFLEIKGKTGATRHKERFPMTVPAAALLSRDLSHPILNEVPGVLAANGYSFEGPLVPMAVVTYERRRYLDAASGTRVALDADIVCPAVNLKFVPGIPPTYVGTGVLELKGGRREMPIWLSPLRPFVRRDAFSKYATCLENLLQPTGRRE